MAYRAEELGIKNDFPSDGKNEKGKEGEKEKGYR